MFVSNTVPLAKNSFFYIDISLHFYTIFDIFMFDYDLNTHFLPLQT
jgi:hypothetical protein